jgi:Ca2+-transporting ATPase
LSSSPCFLGFIQEHRAERALDALRTLAAPIAASFATRSRRPSPHATVVTGDVILLRAGDRVPADSRLTQAINLAVDESALTGESAAVEKTTAAIDRADLPLGDRTNMVYAGTVVTHGRGQAVVVATAMSTEFGHIARMVDMVEAGRTPLQENLDRLGTVLGKARSPSSHLWSCSVWRAAAADRNAHVRHCLGRRCRARGAASGRDDLARDRCDGAW